MSHRGKNNKSGGPQGRFSSDADDDRVSEFLCGRLKTVQEVDRVVGQVVHFRGYYIPSDDKAEVSQTALVQLIGFLRRSQRLPVQNLEAVSRTFAHRSCVDWMRKHIPTEPIPNGVVDPHADPSADAVLKERRRLAGKVIRKLREPCQQLFRLSIGADLNYKEIASTQGRSVGAIRTQMSQCLKEARQIMQRVQARQRFQVVQGSES